MAMSVSYDLSRAWRDYVVAGKIDNVFSAGYNGPNGKWKEGDQIKVGLKLSSKGCPSYFAVNLTRKKEIQLAIKQGFLKNGFSKQFNPYRLLRPGTPPKKRKPGSQSAPSDGPAGCGFKCEDKRHPWSLLIRDPFTLMTMPNGFWACYDNFCPFEEKGHFLWIPVKVRGDVIILPHFPQVMSLNFLTDGLALFKNSNGLLFFFNSLHAGASQNHFHFQAVFTGKEPFAIESAERSDERGHSYLKNYPIEGLVFPLCSPPEVIWTCIDQLSRHNIPYNLIMLGESVYLIPRNQECEIVEEFQYGVLASMEMAGKFILSNEDNYRGTRYSRVVSALRKISLERNKIAEIISTPLS